MSTEFGQFTDYEARVQGRKMLVSDISLDTLKTEVRRREEVLPFVRLVDQIVARAEGKGAALSRERLVYELSYDSLDRPEMFIGYNLSDLTTTQILEEDEKIRTGKLPLREKDGGRVEWSQRFVIYDPCVVRPYHGDETPESLQHSVDEFAGRLRRKIT